MPLLELYGKNADGEIVKRVVTEPVIPPGTPAGAVVPFYNVSFSDRHPIFWGETEPDSGWIICDGGSDLSGGSVPNLSELAQVKANFTQAEIESWSKQEQGAKDIQAGNTSTEAAQFVAAIAQGRGIDVSVLMAKILANVASYGALSAAVIGEQQRLDDLIKAATTAADLEAIVWTFVPEYEA